MSDNAEKESCEGRDESITITKSGITPGPCASEREALIQQKMITDFALVSEESSEQEESEGEPSCLCLPCSVLDRILTLVCWCV